MEKFAKDVRGSSMRWLVLKDAKGDEYAVINEDQVSVIDVCGGFVYLKNNHVFSCDGEIKVIDKLKKIKFKNKIVFY